MKKIMGTYNVPQRMTYTDTDALPNLPATRGEKGIHHLYHNYLINTPDKSLKGIFTSGSPDA